MHFMGFCLHLLSLPYSLPCRNVQVPGTAVNSQHPHQHACACRVPCLAHQSHRIAGHQTKAIAVQDMPGCRRQCLKEEMAMLPVPTPPPAKHTYTHTNSQTQQSLRGCCAGMQSTLSAVAVFPERPHPTPQIAHRLHTRPAQAGSNASKPCTAMHANPPPRTDKHTAVAAAAAQRRQGRTQQHLLGHTRRHDCRRPGRQPQVRLGCCRDSWDLCCASFPPHATAAHEPPARRAC